jgi:AmiR/NasT family two-component response regulator
LSDWDEALGQLDPKVSQYIRSAASRAGLQAHDPAARLITEMWVAVAAMRAERAQLREEIAGLRRGVEETQRLGRALIVLAGMNILLFVGWLLW